MTNNNKTSRIDKILQYVLAVAAESEDPYCRQLGPIHLIKYVYLADLIYSTSNNGAAFTGVVWQFYHYGPWSMSVFERLEPALDSIGATLTEIPSTKIDKDIRRWSIQSDDDFIQALANSLPSNIAHRTRRLVQKFGNDTASLLDYVYKTEPMLKARPNDNLNFSHVVVSQFPIEQQIEISALSVKDRKKRDAHLDTLRDSIQARLAEKRLTKIRRTTPMIAPKYDEEFFDGLSWLDSLAGETIEETRQDVVIDDSVWSIPGRDEIEIP